MFRSPSGRKSAGRARAARRSALVVSLFVVAATLPFVNTKGAEQQQQEEVQLRTKSELVDKGEANVIAGAEFVPGEVLVRFRTDAAAKSAEAAPASLRPETGGDVTFQRFEGSDIVRGLRLAKVKAARTLEAVAELASRPDVLYAEPNYIWRVERTPNDPRFGEMYGLSRINAPAAWDRTIGSRSIVVGVLDGGVDLNHPDLQANIWTNPGDPVDGNDNDGNGFVDDLHGWDFHNNNSSIFDNEDGDDHATHVAGTIGATGDNNVGVSGVNWEVSLMSLKVLGPTGGSVSRIINGYNYARTMRQRWDSSGGTQGANIRVLNNSYGGPGRSLAALDAIQQLNAAGILFVVAAGNNASDNFSFPDYPANYDVPNVISVAATTSFDGLSGFSNFGARLVSIGAPGSGILSTTPNNTYSFFSGTSMASPHVAGAAALVCAANPNITLSQLRGVIAYTGDRISALDGNTITGRRLNVANAVASALENGGAADSTAPAPVGSFRVAGQSGRNITLAWTASGDDGNAGTAADYDLFFINTTTQVRTLLPTTLIPAPAGTQQTVAVNVPFRNFSGTIQLRVYDNAGNSNASSVAVTIPINPGSNPYSVALSAASSVPPTSGTTLVTGDDKYTSYNLPFAFPFYGVSRTSMTVSTNGTLYFSTPPRRDNGDADDAGSSIEGLQGQTMIAGLWDDIDINTSVRPDSGVFVTQADANHIVFRWQGVTFASPRGQVNFEIELRRDGTIITRYGENTNLYPVVGISGGEPDAYVVASHTRDATIQAGPRISLTNRETVTFTPRVQQFYTISGRVLDAASAGVPASVFLSGSQNAVRMTDSGGNYSFTGLAEGGNYTVTPSHPNYNFAPASISLTNLPSNQAANFTASLKTPTGPNSVGFAQASYQHSEADARATFTITRTGDTSGTARVDYRTTDTDTFTVGCADTVSNAGGAFARCDFATTVGTLSFAAGEQSKIVTVPIIDDGHVEGAETFQLQLSNAAGEGTTLGAQNVSTVTITNSDATGDPNPIITAAPTDYPIFVRQQYLDFLSREPEAGEPWTAVMNRCANVNTGPTVRTDCDRIAVSGAFFGSPEFQLKGFYVFRFYRLAFNRLPQYTEFVSDTSFVAGATEAEVYARRAQLATAFAARQEFANAYGGMTNAQYVATLLARYQIALVRTPDPATPDGVTKIIMTDADLTNSLNDGALTRVQVLRAIADSDQVAAAEYNSAFVAVQYYGYLRRTPEPVGYQQNLTALQAGTSPREMINAFLNSAEYRLRFGQP